MVNPAIRPQYHLRRTSTGIDAFDVGILIKLSREFTVHSVDPTEFQELNEDHWYFQNTSRPTPYSIIEHLRLIEQADLSYPVILDAKGRVMDGMHRICKAVLTSVSQIPAVQFNTDPTPTFVDCDPAGLPYGDGPSGEAR